MKIKVLGCYGNNLQKNHTTSLLINKTIAIDAGALTSSLSLKEQIVIDHILITHSHLDHIHELAFLGDNIINRKDEPIKIISEKRTLDALSNHYFNGTIWPDFTKIPSKENPVFEYQEISPNEEFKINGLEFKALRSSHTVPSLSFVIRDYKNSVVHVTDTGNSDDIWNEINKEENLKSIFLETSFPNEMKELAKASKHLTPYGMMEELKKINKKEMDIDVYIYHLKPIYLTKLTHQIEKLKMKGFNIKLMKQDEIISYV